MGDGSGDLQRVWHEYTGQLFDGVSILDVGAGIGRSKDRLSRGGRNHVLTHEINRAYGPDVDIVAYLQDIVGEWDIVTSFDVIEHVPSPEVFLADMLKRAKIGVLVSTPNHHLYPQPWHFTPETFDKLRTTKHARYFLRHRVADLDEVKEVSHKDFLANKDAYALGMFLEKPCAR